MVPHGRPPGARDPPAAHLLSPACFFPNPTPLFFLFFIKVGIAKRQVVLEQRAYILFYQARSPARQLVAPPEPSRKRPAEEEAAPAPAKVPRAAPADDDMLDTVVCGLCCRAVAKRLPLILDPILQMRAAPDSSSEEEEAEEAEAEEEPTTFRPKDAGQAETADRSALSATAAGGSGTLVTSRDGRHFTMVPNIVATAPGWQPFLAAKASSAAADAKVPIDCAQPRSAAPIALIIIPKYHTHTLLTDGTAEHCSARGLEGVEDERRDC